MAGPEELEE